MLASKRTPEAHLTVGAERHRVRDPHRLRWRDAPSAYGPHKTRYERWKRWGERGVFARMMEGLATAEVEPKTVMVDAIYLRRTARHPACG